MEIVRLLKSILLIFHLNKKLAYLLILIQFTLYNRAKCNDNNFIQQTNNVESERSNHQSKLKYHDVWYEINESIILNCSLRVNRDQHVVWHRKYDKMGVHVLTIGSETFISDLRIRPIKHHVSPAASLNNLYIGAADSTGGLNSTSQLFAAAGETGSLSTATSDDYKLTWNLEIRRLRKDDTAFYYCVLNSENAYGQIYKLNVLSHLRFLNKSEIYMEDTEHVDVELAEHDHQEEHHHHPHNHQDSRMMQRSVTLACLYEDVIKNPKDQIKWYFNKHRIRSALDEAAAGTTTQTPIKMLNNEHHITTTSNNQQQFSSSFSPNHHFTITQSLTDDNYTLSTLTIHNFNLKYNYGRYRCQYKGLIKTVKIFPNHRNESSTRLLYKQSVFSVASSSSSSSSRITTTTSSLFSTSSTSFSTLNLFFSLYLYISSCY